MVLDSMFWSGQMGELVDESISARTINSLNRALGDDGLDPLTSEEVEDICILLGEHRAAVSAYRTAHSTAHEVRAELRALARGEPLAYYELSTDAMATVMYYEHMGLTRQEAAREALEDDRPVGRPDTMWRARLVRDYIGAWRMHGGAGDLSGSENSPLGRWVGHLLNEAEGRPVDRRTVRQLIKGHRQA